MNMCRQQRTDNRGMTLVELLVAIVLLAIVVVPLLHTFVSSANTNKKARERLRVTTAAQDIMEGLKADTIEELAYQFNYPDVSHALNPNIVSGNEFHIIKKELVLSGINEIRAVIDPITHEVTSSALVDPTADPVANPDGVPSVHSDDGGETYEFVEKSDHKYYFTMQNVTLQNASFDALIEIDASPYRTPTGSPISANSTLHNDKMVVDISGMNTRQDAFYVQNADMISNVLQELNATYNPTPVITADDLSLTITIDVSNVISVSGNDLTKAKINYTYKTTGATPYVYAKDYNIFSNYATGTELRNVYLFYFPLYDGVAPDEIIYNNPELVPATFYIAKQEPLGLDIAYLNSREAAYRCNIRISEPGIIDRADSVTAFRTNLDTNLCQTYGSSLPADTQASYFYNGILVNKADFFIEPLSGEVVKDRIFDITIDIYEQGSAASGFPIENKLTTITGSKN